MHDPTSGRWSEVFTARYAATTATLCLGVGLYAFSAFLVSTALPSAVLELGGVRLISWASTLFLIASIVTGAAAALLKHRFGTRRAMFGGAVAFFVGTLIAGAAGSMETVLVGRLLQGAGEGVIAALCYTLIPELYPSRLVPKVFGVEAIVWAAAAFGGPLLSGALTETLSWRVAFLINIPMILLFAALVAIIVPRRTASEQTEAQTPFPSFRLAGCAAGMLLLSFAGVLENGFLTAACIVAAAAFLAGIGRIDRRSAERLFPRDAFSLSRASGAGFWAVLLMPVAQSSSAVYLVFITQEALGYGPTVAGLFGAAAAISWSVAAIVVANVDAPAMRRLFIQCGPALVGAGLVGLVFAFRFTSPLLILASQITIGSGFGLSWAFLSQTVMEQPTPEERDRASALVPTLQSGGHAIGAAIAGLVANSVGLDSAQAPGGMGAAAGWVFGVAAGWAFLGALIMARAAAVDGAPPSRPKIQTVDTA